MSPHVVRTTRPLPALAWTLVVLAPLQAAAALPLLLLLPSVAFPPVAFLGATVVAAFVVRRLAAAPRAWRRARRLTSELRILRAPLPPSAVDACLDRSDGVFSEGLVLDALHRLRQNAATRLHDDDEHGRRSYVFYRMLRPLRPAPLSLDPLLLLLALAVWRAGGLALLLPGIEVILAIAAAPIVLGSLARWAMRGAIRRLSRALASWTIETSFLDTAPLSALPPKALFAPAGYRHTLVYRARARTALRPAEPHPSVATA